MGSPSRRMAQTGMEGRAKCCRPLVRSMQLVRLAALAAVAGTALGGNGSHAATDSLLWGTFRPNLYFGMRARLPHSVLTGLMWYGAHDYQSLSRTSPPADRAHARHAPFVRAGRRARLVRLHPARWPQRRSAGHCRREE